MSSDSMLAPASNYNESGWFLGWTGSAPVKTQQATRYQGLNLKCMAQEARNPRKPAPTQHVSLGNLRLQRSRVLAPNMTDVVVSPRESSPGHGIVLKLAEGSNLFVTLSVRGRYVASKVLETIATRESAARLCAFEASIVGFPMLTGHINQ